MSANIVREVPLLDTPRLVTRDELALIGMHAYVVDCQSYLSRCMGSCIAVEHTWRSVIVGTMRRTRSGYGSVSTARAFHHEPDVRQIPDFEHPVFTRGDKPFAIHVEAYRSNVRFMTLTLSRPQHNYLESGCYKGIYKR
jgi:hypothetical protein